MRVNFCPQHWLLYHLGLYKFDFEFDLNLLSIAASITSFKADGRIRHRLLACPIRKVRIKWQPPFYFWKIISDIPYHPPHPLLMSTLSDEVGSRWAFLA